MSSPPHAHNTDSETMGVPEDSGNGTVSQSENQQRAGNGMRMVYEDDLRRACDKRLLNVDQMKRWLDLRRRLPINRWIDRNSMIQAGSEEVKELIAELEDYLALFGAEAREMPFELDMDRNYYRAAVKLMNGYTQGGQFGEKDRKILTGLMVMVDLKDARLAMQILASIV